MITPPIIVGCVVTEAFFDSDGDLRLLTLTNPDGLQYVVDANDDGYQIMDVQQVL